MFPQEEQGRGIAGGPVHLGLAYSSYLYPSSMYIPPLGSHGVVTCGFLPQLFPAEIVQVRCVNTMETWFWPQGNLWCPHWVSLEVFPSWQTGAGGRRGNSLFLSDGLGQLQSGSCCMCWMGLDTSVHVQHCWARKSPFSHPSALLDHLSMTPLPDRDFGLVSVSPEVSQDNDP